MELNAKNIVINLFLLVFLTTILTSLNGQNNSAGNSIQIDFSMARTLHYNQPVDLILCIDGCFVEEQNPGYAPNIDISFYKNLNFKNSIKFGVGLSGYKFFEKGLASPGDNSLLPYQRHVEFRYFNFSAGHRYIFGSFKMMRPYFENSLHFEILTDESRLLKKHGLAVKSQIGMLLSIFKKLDFAVSGFYKTGIIPYNNKVLNKYYIPLGYGLELGLNVKI